MNILDVCVHLGGDPYMDEVVSTLTRAAEPFGATVRTQRHPQCEHCRERPIHVVVSTDRGIINLCYVDRFCESILQEVAGGR